MKSPAKSTLSLQSTVTSKSENKPKTGERAMPATLDQQRAAYAWQRVQGCTREYVNLAKAAPALVMNNGLMQTLAFYESKGKPHHQQLARHLSDWLYQQNQVTDSNFGAVMTSLQSTESSRYRQATEEALALLRWIRQFAAAEAPE